MKTDILVLIPQNVGDIEKAHDEVSAGLEMFGDVCLTFIEPIQDGAEKDEESLKKEVKDNLDQLITADIVYLYNPNGSVDIDTLTLFIAAGNQRYFYDCYPYVCAMCEVTGAHYLDFHYDVAEPAELALNIRHDIRELTRAD